MAEEAVKTVTKSIEDFTVEFHKNVAGKTEGNFVSSALSAHVVLAMAAYGADGNTAKEMRQALHLPEKDEHAYQGFQNFIDTLNNVQKVILKIANKIYANQNISIKDQFKEITSKYFRSESSAIDFSKNVESAAEINKWCVDKTNGKIDQLISPADLDSSTVMVLLNAVYFKGSWKNKFNERATESKPFHVNKTTTVQVPTMYMKEKFFYKELPEMNADVVGLPYENEDLLMVVIVPKEIDGLANIENNLEKIQIDYAKDLRYKREICLSLPKFKIETTIDLNSHLADLGMKEMFDNNANFTGIADAPIKVSKVKQKAFIEVNEEGSEAAAVTGVKLMMRCMPMPDFELQVDRPFLYRIVDKVHNITLFAGRVVQPNETQST